MWARSRVFMEAIVEPKQASTSNDTCLPRPHPVHASFFSDGDRQYFKRYLLASCTARVWQFIFEGTPSEKNWHVRPGHEVSAYLLEYWPVWATRWLPLKP